MLKLKSLDVNYQLVEKAMSMYADENDEIELNPTDFWDWMWEEFAISRSIDQNRLFFHNEHRETWFWLRIGHENH